MSANCTVLREPAPAAMGFAPLTGLQLQPSESEPEGPLFRLKSLLDQIKEGD